MLHHDISDTILHHIISHDAIFQFGWVGIAVVWGRVVLYARVGKGGANKSLGLTLA